MPRLPPKWPPHLRNDVDDPLADLVGELRELAAIELLDVVRSVDGVENSAHVWRILGAALADVTCDRCEIVRRGTGDLISVLDGLAEQPSRLRARGDDAEERRVGQLPLGDV